MRRFRIASRSGSGKGDDRSRVSSGKKQATRNIASGVDNPPTATRDGNEVPISVCRWSKGDSLRNLVLVETRKCKAQESVECN